MLPPYRCRGSAAGAFANHPALHGQPVMQAVGPSAHKGQGTDHRGVASARSCRSISLTMQGSNDHDWTTADRPGCGRACPVERLRRPRLGGRERSEEHTSELQPLMRISYAVFCLTKNNTEHIP